MILLLLPILLMASDAPPAIDPGLASRAFQEARLASEADGGRLWGRPLYGPLLFVEPKSLAVVANQADREGKLERAGDVYIGRLPAGSMVANTATTWAGVTWAMVMWPPPDSAVG